MRIECATWKDAEKVASLVDECHIQRKGDKVYVVIDKARRKDKEAYA